MGRFTSLLRRRTRWFWLGVPAGLLTPVLAVLLYVETQQWQDDRAAQQLTEKSSEVDPETFDAAGREFAEELVTVFQDLPAGDMKVTSELWHRGCHGTQQQAKHYDGLLRGTAFENEAELTETIEALTSELEDSPEWNKVGHEPPHDGMDGRETWSYQWEHEGATMVMELESQDRSGLNLALNAAISSDCYNVQGLTGSNRYGPDELM